MRKLWLTLVVVAALVLSIGAVAYASIPDSSGVIHGCRKNSDGSVRVIDTDLGQTCSNGWTPLNWSQSGPTAITVTVVRNYAPPPPPFPPNFFVSVETVTCPTGSKAINGGVTQANLGADWPGGGVNSGGTAVQVFGDEGLAYPNPNVPRPVDNGAGWRLKLTGLYPEKDSMMYSLDVTLYAICLGAA